MPVSRGLGSRCLRDLPLRPPASRAGAGPAVRLWGPSSGPKDLTLSGFYKSGEGREWTFGSRTGRRGGWERKLRCVQ